MLRFLVAVLLVVLCGASSARDSGPWIETDAGVRDWYSRLMQPDNPAASCCGEADAYWADEVHVKGGVTIATITDDRDDAKLHRPHIPNGTQVIIPDNKLKWDRGNPTGHGILFMNSSLMVFCFVQPTGI